MEGKWAILDTSMKCIEIYEGDISLYDVSVYENYGGEIKVSEPFIYREAEVGKTFNHKLDKFE
jgi:hypothetical protein